MTDILTTAGIDVSQDWLDIYIHPLGHARRMGNHAQGLTQLIAWLGSYELHHIACEATGGLERLLVQCLQQAKLPVQVVNPSRIAAFRQAAGKLAKTDAQDAELIALFAARMGGQEREPLSPSAQLLKDYAARRRQLVEMQVQERNRLKRVHDTYAKESIRRVIALLEDERRALETLMLEHVKADSVMERRKVVLTSIPGIGEVVAMTLISEMPELGMLNDKQAAALAGIAPVNRQSGKNVGKASIRSSRKCVRTALYMATIAAKKHNPAVKSFYERLVANGKPKMVALIAAMRKLLLQANRLVEQDKLWRPPVLD